MAHGDWFGSDERFGCVDRLGAVGRFGAGKRFGTGKRFGAGKLLGAVDRFGAVKRFGAGPNPWRLFSVIVLAAVASGCIGSQQTVQTEVDDFTSKFPAVTVSDTRIHSPTGDMSARLPENWVRLDVDKLESPELFAVACNPEYTVSLIFSAMALDNAVRKGYDRGGMAGLAEASYERRRKRSAGRAVLVADYEEFTIGRRRFGAYTYSTDSSRTMTRVAVFYTATNLYECAVTHLTFSDRELPTLRTLREIHQLVLSTVEW